MPDAEPELAAKRPPHANRTGARLLVSAAAALLACGLVSTKHPLLNVSDKFSFGMGAPNEVRLSYFAEKARIDRWNAAFVFAVSGSLLAATLGATAESCCAASLRILVGLVWGAFWGAATGFTGVMVAAALKPKGTTLPSLTDVGMAQAALFALLGLGLGIFVGGFSRSARRIVGATVTATIAGGIAGLIFPIVAGLVSPLQSTQDLIPTELLLRCLWLVLPFVGIAAAVADRRVVGPLNPEMPGFSEKPGI